MEEFGSPPVYVIEYTVGRCFTMFNLEVFTDPCHEMVLEHAFDNLMEEVGRQHLVNICMWKIICKRLSKSSEQRKPNKCDIIPLDHPLCCIGPIIQREEMHRCSIQRVHATAGCCYSHQDYLTWRCSCLFGCQAIMYAPSINPTLTEGTILARGKTVESVLDSLQCMQQVHRWHV